MQLDADWLRAKAPNTVFKALHEAGHQTYFVGGCIRNTLLQKDTTDIDIATDALPETVLKIAKSNAIRAIPTGLDHGTITLVIDGDSIEVTTFRKDVATDGRRAVVNFSNNIKDDAKRRDFTMNALYADLDGTVIDPLEGLNDLLVRRVKFIENPAKRIQEDYLRILRFFRFHALYGDPNAGLDPEALHACTENLDGLESLSKERIGHEMRKLLAAKDPAPSIAAMEQTGVLMRIISGTIISSLAPLVHLENTVSAKPDWMRRLVAIGGHDVQNALRLSKQEARLMTNMKSVIENATSARVAGHLLGADRGRDSVLVLSAHLGTPVPNDLGQELEIGANAEFPITSKDLIDIFSGPKLGTSLKQLKSAWMESGFELSKKDLLKRLHD